MGSKPSLPIVSYEAVTKKISIGEHESLQAAFKELTHRQDVHGHLGQEAFEAKVALRFHAFGPMVSRRLFEVLDRDGRGAINFREYVCCCYLTLLGKGTKQEILRLVFNMWDLAGAGYITKQSFKRMPAMFGAGALPVLARMLVST